MTTMIIRRRTVCHDFGDFSLSKIIENSITKLKYVGSNDELVTPQLLVVFYLFILGGGDSKDKMWNLSNVVECFDLW